MVRGGGGSSGSGTEKEGKLENWAEPQKTWNKGTLQKRKTRKVREECGGRTGQGSLFLWMGGGRTVMGVEGSGES